VTAQDKIPYKPNWAGQRIVLIALPLITLLAYLPAIRGDFIWDDDRHVSANRNLLDLPGLAHIWLRPSSLPQYYPMTHTSFWLEYQIWAADPLGYHIDNVLLHIANSFLLWRLLKYLKIGGAALAATIFALHPIEVETVAWISERKNLLSTFFAFLSLLSYLKSDNQRWPWASFLLFAAAMLSKTVACTVPAVLLVILWWRDGKVRLRELLRLLPFFAVSIGMGIVTALMEVKHVGASGEDWNLSFIQRCLIASRAIWFYLAKIFWPVNLTFSYPRWTIDPHNLKLYLLPLALAGLVASAWLLRRRLGRGPLAAILIFAGVLTPALGFVNTYPMRYSFVADHFQYAAGIAIIALFSSTIEAVESSRVVFFKARKMGVSPILAIRRWRKALVLQFFRAGTSPARAGRPCYERTNLKMGLMIMIFTTMLALLTWRQARVYAGPETLWRDVIAKNDSSWMAMENLGVQLVYQPNPSRAQLEEAVQLFERVEQLRPQHEKLQANWAEALFKLGRWNEALPHYQAATNTPGLSTQVLHDRMGIVLAHLNRWQEAEAMFRAALKIDDSDMVAQRGLANVLAERAKIVR
jgi:tetratricopeptide (TPR) repeat protein